jgi:hypothetical protein
VARQSDYDDSIYIMGPSFLHIHTSGSYPVLQLPGMIRMAGEEEDLVVFREGSDGLDGGGVENAEAHEKGDLE